MRLSTQEINKLAASFGRETSQDTWERKKNTILVCLYTFSLVFHFINEKKFPSDKLKIAQSPRTVNLLDKIVRHVNRYDIVHVTYSRDIPLRFMQRKRAHMRRFFLRILLLLQIIAIEAILCAE